MDSGKVKIVNKFPRQTIAGKNIYFIITAAGKIEKIADMIDELKDQGANVFIFPTPNALNLIEPLTKYKKDIYADFNWHGPRRSIPEEDIVIVAPCTFNTFNKISAGIADNYPTTIVATSIGKKKKVFIVPAFNIDMWNHPQTMKSVATLESWGGIIIWPDITPGKVSMMDYGKALDRVYIETSKIIYDSVQVTSPEVVKMLKSARDKYYKDFKEIGERQEQEGTNSFTNGNYSSRVKNTSWFLITSTGSKLGNLAPEDLTLVNIDDTDKVIWAGEKMPSCDTPMHIEYYRNTTAQAIAHSHCSKITYSEKFNDYKTPNYVRYGKFEPIVPTVPQLILNDGFLILRFHGEVGIGSNLNDAYAKISKYFKLTSQNDKN